MRVKSIDSSARNLELLISHVIRMGEAAEHNLPPVAALGYPSGREFSTGFAKVLV